MDKIISDNYRDKCIQFIKDVSEAPWLDDETKQNLVEQYESLKSELGNVDFKEKYNDLTKMYWDGFENYRVENMPVSSKLVWTALTVGAGMTFVGYGMEWATRGTAANGIFRYVKAAGKTVLVVTTIFGVIPLYILSK